MNLPVCSGGRPQGGVSKETFSLKPPDRDGLILQIHNTVTSAKGEEIRYRFVHAAFDENGEKLTAIDQKGNLFIIDLAGNSFWSITSFGLCTALAFSLHNQHEVLVGICNGEVRIVNIESAKCKCSLVGHKHPVYHLSFHSKKKWVLTASMEEAIIWDLQSNVPVHKLAMQAGTTIKEVLFMPATDYVLACFQDDAIYVWNFENLECLKKLSPDLWRNMQLKSIAFTRDGRAMVLAGHHSSLVVYNVDTWSMTKKVVLPGNMIGVRQIQFVPQHFDGGANKILAVLTALHEIMFMDVETCTVVKKSQTDGSILKFVCSSNGKYTACIHNSGVVSIYNNSQLLSTLHQESTNVTQEEVDKLADARKAEFHQRQKHKALHKYTKVQEELREALNLPRLQRILKHHGWYPEKYRTLIWRTVLQLPQNREAFTSLLNRGTHSAFAHLEDRYPLENRFVMKSLKMLLSCLAHWCPLFGEIQYLPLFVFPFVKIFQRDPFSLFETVLCIIMNFCQHWFEFFPFPPVNVLAVIENTMGKHDPELLQHFCNKRVTTHTYAWPLLENAFSEVLSSDEWLHFWDHVVSNEPAFLISAVVAYNVVFHAVLKACKTKDDFEYFYHNQNPVDFRRFIGKTYQLCGKISADVHPRNFLYAFSPLPKGSYPAFTQYPKQVIDSQAKTMDEIRKEEEDIVKEEQEILQMKVEHEKRMRDECICQEKQHIMKDIEGIYLQKVKEEEERVSKQRERIQALKEQIHKKEMELMEVTQARIVKQRMEQRKASMQGVLEDIARRHAREEQKCAFIEEDAKRRLLEMEKQQKVNSSRTAYPEEAQGVHFNLLSEQHKLAHEMNETRKEVRQFSCFNTKESEILDRLSELEDMLKRIELKLRTELATFDENNAEQTSRWPLPPSSLELAVHQVSKFQRGWWQWPLKLIEKEKTASWIKIAALERDAGQLQGEVDLLLEQLKNMRRRVNVDLPREAAKQKPRPKVGEGEQQASMPAPPCPCLVAQSQQDKRMKQIIELQACSPGWRNRLAKMPADAPRSNLGEHSRSNIGANPSRRSISGSYGSGFDGARKAVENSFRVRENLITAAESRLTAKRVNF